MPRAVCKTARICSLCGGAMKISGKRDKAKRESDSETAIDGVLRERIIRTYCVNCGHEGLIKRCEEVLANSDGY